MGQGWDRGGAAVASIVTGLAATANSGRVAIEECGGGAVNGKPWVHSPSLWRMKKREPSACPFLSLLVFLPHLAPGAGPKGFIWEGNYTPLQPKSERGSYEHLEVFSHYLHPQHSLLPSSSVWTPLLSKTHDPFLHLKPPTWLHWTHFSCWRVKGGQPGLPRVYRTKPHWYSLSNNKQLLSGPDKWAWSPRVTVMDGDPCTRPCARCLSVCPAPWDPANQMAVYGAITQSFSCAGRGSVRFHQEDN